MPRFNNYVIDQLIAPALLLFFFLGGLTAFFIGIGLIFKSPTVSRLFDTLNHSAPTRNATTPLGIPHDRSHFFLRHLIPIGVVFIIGALYADYGLLTGAGNAAIVSMFNATLPPGYVFWIVEIVRYFLMVSGTVSIIVGILMIISPDTRRAIENTGGRRYSAGEFAIDAEKMDLAFDKWVAAYPRTAGLVIVFPALGMVSYFWDQLLRRM
ncbi:MAG: hypothetical protein D4S02_01780 [Rhodocyclaceae bacterium]|nr:MAG: hypothetical protein D4S02_01780 [Rhodocyclaceae bacterium]